MSKNVQAVSDSVFEAEVLKASTPVLVDFWAEWCGPCRMVAPVLEEVAQEFGNRVKFMKLNVDENHQASTNYDVRSIPTLILFKQGAEVARKVGALAKSQLVAFLNSHI